MGSWFCRIIRLSLQGQRVTVTRWPENPQKTGRIRTDDQPGDLGDVGRERETVRWLAGDRTEQTGQIDSIRISELHARGRIHVDQRNSGRSLQQLRMSSSTNSKLCVQASFLDPFNLGLNSKIESWRFNAKSEPESFSNKHFGFCTPNCFLISLSQAFLSKVFPAIAWDDSSFFLAEPNK